MLAQTYQNQTYSIAIETLTPLHIGGTTEKRWVEGMDYVYLKDEKKLYLLAFEQLMQDIAQDREELQKFNTYLSEGSKEKLTKLIGKYLKKPANIQTVFDGIDFPSDEEVFSFVRNGLGELFLPGSSIKGAIRSAFINPYKGAGTLNEESLFGKITNNLMKYFVIGDTKPSFLKSRLYRSKIWNLSGNDIKNLESGWKHNQHTKTHFDKQGFVFTYECLPPKSVAYNHIEIKMGWAERLTQEIRRIQEEIKALNQAIDRLPSNDENEKKRKEKLKADKISELNKLKVPNLDKLLHNQTTDALTWLFGLINANTRTHLQREIAFLRKYPEADNTDMLIEAYEDLLAKVPTDNQSCLLRMAAGSGFHSITGDWRFTNHDKTGTHPTGRHQGKKYIKSRKFLFEQQGDGYAFYPMGFVRLRVVSKEEVAAEAERARAAAEAEQEKISLAAEAAAREAERSSKPQFTQEKIRKGTMVEAVTHTLGITKTFTLYLNESQTQNFSIRYPSDDIVGKICIVRVEELDRNGKVSRATFLKLK